MKKIIIIVFLLGIAVFGNALCSFTEDVPTEFVKEMYLETYPSSWAKQPIMNLKRSMIFPRITFNVDYKSKITRAQFSELASITYEGFIYSEITIDKSIVFKDSNDPAVLKAATVKILNGIGQGNFNPDGLMTREQLALTVVNLMRLSGLKLDAPTQNTFDDDVAISSWAKEGVYTAVSNGIMNGTGNNKFDPKGNASIEMAMTMVEKILKKHETIGPMEWVDASLIKKDGKYYTYYDMWFYLSEDGEVYSYLYKPQFHLDISEGLERKYVESDFYHVESETYSFEKDFNGDSAVRVKEEEVYNSLGKVVDIFSTFKITFNEKDLLYKSNLKNEVTFLSDVNIRKIPKNSLHEDGSKGDYNYIYFYNEDDYYKYFGFERPYVLEWSSERNCYILNFDK